MIILVCAYNFLGCGSGRSHPGQEFVHCYYFEFHFTSSPSWRTGQKPVFPWADLHLSKPTPQLNVVFMVSVSHSCPICLCLSENQKADIKRVISEAKLFTGRTSLRRFLCCAWISTPPHSIISLLVLILKIFTMNFFISNFSYTFNFDVEFSHTERCWYLINKLYIFLWFLTKACLFF